MEIVLPVQFVKKSQKAQQLDNELMPVNNFFVDGLLILILNDTLMMLKFYQLIKHFLFTIMQIHN